MLWTKLAERTYRTGVQALWQHADGRYAVTIKNRTYRSVVEIPPEKAELWRLLLSSG